MRTREKLTRKQYNALSAEEKEAHRKAKLEAAQASFEQAIDELVGSQKFNDYLTAASRLHKYSVRNTLWVMAQRHGDLVPPLASFRDWKTKLGYQVRKGEEGAVIWVRTTIKTDEIDEDGEPVRIARYKPGSVFSRDQVDPIEGKALNLDPPASEPIDGDSHQFAVEKLIALVERSGLTYRAYKPGEGPDDLSPNAEGYHSAQRREIGCLVGQPSNAQVRVLAHELIHSFGVSYETYGRRRAEAITDTATYLACAAIGLDVGKASVPYVAAWAGASATELGGDLSLMGQLADRLLKESGLENHLALSEAEKALRAKEDNG